MARQLDASKQQHWLQHMRLWQQSQLSVRGFCARHGLSQPSFYAWRRRLRERGLLEGSAAVAVQAPAFVKLAVATPAPAGVPVDLVLSQRRLLRVPPGFDPDTLLQLVRLLEEPAC